MCEEELGCGLGLSMMEEQHIVRRLIRSGFQRSKLGIFLAVEGVFTSSVMFSSHQQVDTVY